MGGRTPRQRGGEPKAPPELRELHPAEWTRMCWEEMRPPPAVNDFAAGSRVTRHISAPGRRGESEEPGKDGERAALRALMEGEEAGR